MDQNRLVITYVLITILILSLFGGFGDAFAQSKLKKEQIKQCEYLYFNYKKFGEEKFRDRYEFKSFIKECIKLYKDPKWTFTGKDKIDEYFDKLNKRNNKIQDNSEQKLTTKIKQKAKVGNMKYLIVFEACVIAQKSVLPSFLISTDIEKFIVTSSKTISSNKCRNYTTFTFAESPSNIKLDFIEEPSKYPNLKVRKIS